jgi:two-component system chemotaxis response regulator CheB
MPESRDIIVLGGSAGALDALTQVFKGLDPHLPAAIFVVVHTGQEAPGFLARIFRDSTSLEVRYAEDREPIELGTIYVAPPDRHMLVKPGEVRVVRGPKENNFRPALDPLFRSAAYTYGKRVVGAVFSGMLDDGSHGLYQIKEHGGVTIAQDPNDAQHPSMPQSAIAQANVDHVLAAAEIGPLLNMLTRPDGDETAGPAREQLDVAEGAHSGLAVPNRSPSSELICPECGGALWELEEGNLVRYRCHVGHGFSGQTLSALQDAEIEQALWTSVRLLEEQAELQKRLAERWKTPGNQFMRDRFTANADDRAYAADLVRSLITGRQQLPERAEHSPAVREEYSNGS